MLQSEITHVHYVQELQELKEAQDEQPDDLASLQEAVEMATLDKEMAEEKVILCTALLRPGLLFSGDMVMCNSVQMFFSDALSICVLSDSN